VLPALQTTGLYDAVLAGAAINAFLALFNLIPFSIFDGRKVYTWNRVYWAALFLFALALTIYANFVLVP
jgi:Zn-dependent protease